jgi:hypothetical protein
MMRPISRPLRISHHAEVLLPTVSIVVGRIPGSAANAPVGLPFFWIRRKAELGVTTILMWFPAERSSAPATCRYGFTERIMLCRAGWNGDMVQDKSIRIVGLIAGLLLGAILFT